MLYLKCALLTSNLCTSIFIALDHLYLLITIWTTDTSVSNSNTLGCATLPHLFTSSFSLAFFLFPFHFLSHSWNWCDTTKLKAWKHFFYFIFLEWCRCQNVRTLRHDKHTLMCRGASLLSIKTRQTCICLSNSCVIVRM